MALEPDDSASVDFEDVELQMSDGAMVRDVKVLRVTPCSFIAHLSDGGEE